MYRLQNDKVIKKYSSLYIFLFIYLTLIYFSFFLFIYLPLIYWQHRAFPCNSKANVFIPWLTEKAFVYNRSLLSQFVRPSIQGINQHRSVYWKYATKHARSNFISLLQYIFAHIHCGFLKIDCWNFGFKRFEKNEFFFRNMFYEMRNTVVEKMTTLEFETELRNSWLLWEVSEGWWVGERISQCEIGHWWLQQILRLKLVTFLLWQFRQKFHLYLLMCSLFINVYLFSNW